MDVDNDLEGQLLQQFSSMGTTDKDVLIAEFQKLLGNQLNPSCCAFFLDMNNWNLQAAICSYYDYEQPNVKVPCMAFVRDITIGEGESVPPKTRFVKTWRIQNIGDEKWPPACSLKFLGGEQFGHQERVLVDALNPGEITDVSIEMGSPTTTGIFSGQWRMSTPTGLFFGEIIWVILTVEENGLLGVTQQLSNFGAELSQQSPQQRTTPDNPFSSPRKLETNSLAPFGSPSLSMIAQPGSMPNSPLEANTSHTAICPSSNVRTTLFPSSEVSSQDATHQQTPTTQSEMDSDMS